MQIVIIGGGRSINDGLPRLKKELKGKFVIATNYAYKYFPFTVLCFCDYKFYKEEKDNIESFPLLIANKTQFSGRRIKNPNMIYLPVNPSVYTRDLSKGVYKGITGIFSLSIAIYLLDRIEDEKKEIFLLGMDFGCIKKEGDKIVNGKPVIDDIKGVNRKYLIKGKYRALTHFYDKELTHQGSSKIDYYYNHSPRNIYKPFDAVKDIKIWNVSPESRIPNFEKIDYLTFFALLDPIPYEQDSLRAFIKDSLKKVKNSLIFEF